MTSWSTLRTTLFLSASLLWCWTIVDWAPPQNETLNILREQLDRYPEMTGQDIYKLVYQSIMGPGHYGTDTNHIVMWLQQEAMAMGFETPPDSLPLTEEIGNGYLRVNLWPFLKSGGSLEALAEAQVASTQKAPDSAELQKTWHSVKSWARQGLLKPLSGEEIDQLTPFLEEKSWPAMHHSEKYSREYLPHYRVVSKSSLTILESK